VRGFVREDFEGWRGLVHFWLLVLCLLTVAGAVLQWLGPPSPSPPVRDSRTAPSPVPGPEALTAAKPAEPRPEPVTEAVSRPGRDLPGPVADPDPALLEPDPASTGQSLPKIALDGRMPMQVYAAGFDRPTRRTRVGLLLAGFGLNEADSAAAARALPGGITFAISPYFNGDLRKLLDVVRAHEHEYLLSVPMEPSNFPANDPGPQALMTDQTPIENLKRLNWSLSRLAGYAGVTAALGTMHGERFLAVPDQLESVLTVLSQRGLLFVDSRKGDVMLPRVWHRGIDLVIDEPANPEAIEVRLAELTKLAITNGTALGLATTPRPVTIERIAAWANGLMDKGLALAPVSALARPPADPEPAR